MINRNREFILIEKKVEAENVTSLFLKPVDGLEYNFIAGQYVNIKPNSSGYGKSYTISNAPHEENICITIKRKGETSSALIDMKVGEKIFLEGPFGYFYPESYDKEIVMIAGGIGITPFYSVIKNITGAPLGVVTPAQAGVQYPNLDSRLYGNNIESGSIKSRIKVTLFYSNQNIKDITFFDKLNEIAKNNPQINVVHCLTQDTSSSLSTGKTKHDSIKEYSRIDKNILKKHLGNFEDKNYFICGSIEFVNSMWKLVKDEGVHELNIFTESFF